MYSPLPKNKADLDALNIQLQKADPQMYLEDNSYTDYRKAMFSADWFTNTVCGNCRSVCWHNRDDREQNRQLIINSGIVALQLDGEHIATEEEEVIELDTPYTVKVALLKKEYKKALASGMAPGRIQGKSPIDAGVLSYIMRNLENGGKFNCI